MDIFVWYRLVIKERLAGCVQIGEFVCVCLLLPSCQKPAKQISYRGLSTQTAQKLNIIQSLKEVWGILLKLVAFFEEKEPIKRCREGCHTRTIFFIAASLKEHVVVDYVRCFRTLRVLNFQHDVLTARKVATVDLFG
jgi:hypothetical protein